MDSEQHGSDRELQEQTDEGISGIGGNDSIELRRKQYLRGRKLMGHRLARAIKGKFPDTYRWLTDIVPSVRFEDAQRLVNSATRFKEKTILIVWHPEEETEQKGHCHLYHICSYNQSNCRCTFLKSFKIKRRDPRRSNAVNTIDSAYFVNWLDYFLTHPRRILHIQVNGISNWGEIHRLKNLRQSHGCQDKEAERALEGGEFPSQDSDWAQRFGRDCNEKNPITVGGTTDSTSDGHNQLSRIGIIPRKQLNAKIHDHDSLVEQILKLCVVPFENSCNNQMWIADKYLRFYDSSDPDFKRACSTVRRTTAFLTLDELIRFHSDNSRHGIFYATHDDYYLDEDDSFQWVNKLLIHQYGENGVKDFLNRLLDITEKRIPKKNTMFILGRANCGKTWFINMIAAFYINVGNVKNYVRGQNFPFNDCVNRRLLIWNEPSVMLSAMDTLKQLTEGDHISVAVKYHGDTVLQRTPIIFTSNHQIFKSDQPVWTSRIYFEEWKIAPMLKDCKKYPHPKCFEQLLKFYSLI